MICVWGTRIPMDMCAGNTHPWETHIPVTLGLAMPLVFIASFCVAHVSIKRSTHEIAPCKPS